MKKSVKSNFVSFLLGLAFTLVGVELLLRILGFGYNLIHPLPRDIGAEYRILCIGESTTFGIGASDPIKKGYPYQLEKLLNGKDATKKAQCFFDQAIGINTSEILRKFPGYIKKHRPSLIVFMVGVNNWWNLDRSNILLFNRNMIISESALKIYVFMARFRIWKLAKWIYYSLFKPEDRWRLGCCRQMNVGEVVEYHNSTHKKYNYDIFNQLAYYDLKAMLEICKANKIKVVISTYPVGGGAAGDINLVLRKIASEYLIPLADNELYFRKLDISEYTSPVDRWHPNDKGYRVVAQNIYNCILDNKLIE